MPDKKTGRQWPGAGRFKPAQQSRITQQHVYVVLPRGTPPITAYKEDIQAHLAAEELNAKSRLDRSPVEWEVRDVLVRLSLV